MTQFYSLLPRDELLAMLIEALQVQAVVTPSLEDVVDESGNIRVPIHHVDKRRCPLQGEIRIMRYNNHGVWVVKFVKGRGDPLEFRRFFKVRRDTALPLMLLDHGHPLQGGDLRCIELWHVESIFSPGDSETSVSGEVLEEFWGIILLLAWKIRDCESVCIMGYRYPKKL
jgi:hypothetical protein